MSTCRFTSPLAVLNDQIEAHPDVQADVLAESSPASLSISPDDPDFIGTNPGLYFDGPGFTPDENKYPLIVELSGSFTSYFKGKESPIGDRSWDKDKAVLEESEAPGRVLVIGTRKLIEGNLWGWTDGLASNEAFFLNLMDYYNLSDVLLGMRSSKVISRPLEKQWISVEQVAERQLDKEDKQFHHPAQYFVAPGADHSPGGDSLRRQELHEAGPRDRHAQGSCAGDGVSDIEKAEFAGEVSYTGFAFMAGSIVLMLLALGGLFFLVTSQVEAQRAAKANVLAKQQEKLFPQFERDKVERIEIWEILGKTVLTRLQAGENPIWQVGNVPTPRTSLKSTKTRPCRPNRCLLMSTASVRC